MQSGFPSPYENDPEDVAWGLTTGAALWRQGERYDAIVWLKRAVEAATEAGAATRADELNRAATDLIASLAAASAVARPAPASPARPPSGRQPVPVKDVPSPPRPSAGGEPDRSLTRPMVKAPPAPKGAPAAARAPALAQKAPPLPKPKAAAVSPPAAGAIASATNVEPPPMREPMSSVTTSAPPLEALTSARIPSAIATRLEPPPPPTILPDIGTPPMPEPRGASDGVVPDVDQREGEPPLDLQLSADGSIDLGSPSVAPASEEPVEKHETRKEKPISQEEANGPFSLAGIRAAGDLTGEQCEALFRTARVESLAAEEDLTLIGLALVLEGQIAVQATVADASAAVLKANEAIYAKSSIPDVLSLRLVAEATPTKLALWDLKSIDAAFSSSPELVAQLKRASDRVQALAGCMMGPIGDRLDEGLRALAVDQLEVRILQPHEVIASAGMAVPGMVIVGVGTVELGDDGEDDRLGPGDFLFATEVLGAEPAPATARAGSKGAIILFGERGVAHELLMSCPPLLELFAGM